MIVNLNDLRAKAERATQDKWTSDVWIDSNSYGWRATGPHHESSVSDENAEPGCADEQAAQRDAAFIAAADPQTVLALLDRIAALEAARDEACDLASATEHPRASGAECAAFYERISSLRLVGQPGAGKGGGG